MKTEVCQNCGAEISEHEQAFVHNGHIVCEKCYAELKKQAQESPTTESFVSERRTFKPRTYRIFTLTLCAIGGLIIGFFVGQMYSKYQSRNSFYRKLNSIFSGTAKEIAPADINPRAKHILRVTALGLWGGGLEVELTNISGKDIEAVQGYLFIFDQFGQELDKLRGNFDKPILAGQAVKYLWPINWDYKGRMRELIRTRLWNDEGQKATVKFATQKVLYSDGTQENFKVEK